MTEPTTQALIELADKYAFFMPGSAEGAKVRQQLLDAIEAQAREIEGLKRPKEKIAPVQGWPQGIPWSLHLEAYAVYSKKWGPQPAIIDLEGRNCRGGFSVDELDEFIPGWRERVSELAAVKAERDTLKAELAAIRAVPVADAGLVEDAARWRHLMTCHVHQIAPMFGITFGNYTPEKDTIESVNVTIDAARTQQAQKGGE